MSFKVLISDSVADVCIEKFIENGVEVSNQPGLSPVDLLAQIPEYHGLVVRSATKVVADVIRQGRNLKAIGRAGTGVDNIDLEAATERGIVVLNSQTGNTVSAAEQAFALMMALARNIPKGHMSTVAGKWERNKLKGVELYRKTLGLIGLGKIGQEVAKRAKAFEMTVLAYDPLISSEVFQAAGIEQADLDSIYRGSDFISIHVPHTKQTHYMIGDEVFEICKPSLRLINASRGGVVDESALYRALKDNKIAGAALDVYEQEPPGDSPLFTLENIVLTPHLGASTFEAQDRVALEIAETMCDFFQNKPVGNVVNKIALEKLG
jgi:D-3-phosphoglycerate dehydrogenase